MTPTTKTISLVLIGSAVVFGAWMGAQPSKDDDDPSRNSATGRHYGSSGISHFWGWRSYSGYNNGGSYRSGSGGTSHGTSSGVSIRGGFGGHGAHVGA